MTKQLTPAHGYPIPIRFSKDDEALLRHLKSVTGISLSNIIRRAVRYSAPRFIDGRINLLTLKEGGPALASENLNLETKT